ncbi:hypothetical protein DTB58_39840, partial [Streptomyces griseus]|uniref:hypothetical protein n=1 Tax=Streptomyces griseus TaxID=1911 RepID=UPI001C581037
MLAMGSMIMPCCLMTPSAVAARQDQGPAHSLAIMDARVEMMSFGDALASARFNIVNLGARSDELIEASSPDFESVRLFASRRISVLAQHQIVVPTARIPSHSSLMV